MASHFDPFADADSSSPTVEVEVLTDVGSERDDSPESLILTTATPTAAASPIKAVNASALIDAAFCDNGEQLGNENSVEEREGTAVEVDDPNLGDEDIEDSNDDAENHGARNDLAFEKEPGDEDLDLGEEEKAAEANRCNAKVACRREEASPDCWNRSPSFTDSPSDRFSLAPSPNASPSPVRREAATGVLINEEVSGREIGTNKGSDCDDPNTTAEQTEVDPNSGAWKAHKWGPDSSRSEEIYENESQNKDREENCPSTKQNKIEDESSDNGEEPDNEEIVVNDSLIMAPIPPSNAELARALGGGDQLSFSYASLASPTSATSCSTASAKKGKDALDSTSSGPLSSFAPSPERKTEGDSEEKSQRQGKDTPSQIADEKDKSKSASSWSWGSFGRNNTNDKSTKSKSSRSPPRAVPASNDTKGNTDVKTADGKGVLKTDSKTKEDSVLRTEEAEDAELSGSASSDAPLNLTAVTYLPRYVVSLRPAAGSLSPSDIQPINNSARLIPCQQINSVTEVLEKDFPPPLKKNAVIPTQLPSEMLMPLLLRCDFCQKFDSICSNCNRKWKGIVESRRAVLMNNIKPMQHIRKMGIYFGTVLYGAQDFLQALLTSHPMLKNWCARIGPALVPKGQPADVQLKVADERGRLFGLHVAFAFGKLQSAKTLLENGATFRRCDSKLYPTDFLSSKVPLSEEWDDMLQLQQPYIEFKMAERARGLRREGDFEGAFLEYSALLSLNPNSEHGHCGIAKMLFDQGKYEECLAQCQYIIDVEREAIRAAAAAAAAAATLTSSSSFSFGSSKDKEKERKEKEQKEKEQKEKEHKKAMASASPPRSNTENSGAGAGGKGVDESSSSQRSKSPSTIEGRSIDTAQKGGTMGPRAGSNLSSGALDSSTNSCVGSVCAANLAATCTSAGITVVGGIHWAEFGFATIQSLQKHASDRFHETCHNEPEGPALKRCGCVVTDRTVARVRLLPFKLVLEIMSYCDCSMLWGVWRAVRMPLLRRIAERSGAALCDASVGEMLSKEKGYAAMYERIASEAPEIVGQPPHFKGSVLLQPLRFVGLKVKAMADFNNFVILSAVAGMNPNYKEPDTSVFFPKARKPMEKLRRVVAVKEFFVHRADVGSEWRYNSAGEWEVDERASMTLQLDIQRKLEADEKAKAASVAIQSPAKK